jgi:hypothetical protein
MRSLTSLFAAAAVALCIAACSSSPSDGAAKTPTMPDTSVFDRCVDFASRLCADAAGCCMQAYGGFDADGCLNTFKHDVCRPGADTVTAGKATYNEDAVEACLAAHAQAHTICVPTWQQTLELRKEIYAACRVIDGASKPGLGCSTSASCKHPDGVATVECVKNVCQVIEILPEGAECPFPSGSVSVCDDGLACDAPGLGTSGHCIKAVATGASCDASVLEGTDCGLGSFCDPETSKCLVAENLGGTGCSQSNECVSFDCNRLENSCAAAAAVVSRDTCLGAAQAP